MSTTAAEIRDWAAGNGYEIGDKGRIPAAVKTAYYSQHGGAPVAGPDYPPGMGEDDFTDEPPPPPGGPVPPDDDTGETRPRPASSGASSSRAAWRSWKTKAQGKGKARHARARVPVDDTISGAWRLAARLARPVPPLQRTLRVQAPVAGMLLEDGVKGTAIDIVLQPLARFQAGGRTAAALAGPPVLVTAITLHCQRQALEGQPPNPLFMATAMEMLREALMLWMDVAGPKFDAALAREREFEERHGQSVDDLIAWLLSEPANPADPVSVAEEEENIRRAQGLMTDAA